MESESSVVSSPIIIPRITNTYQMRYSEEHLDEYREQYSEIFVEQPPPLYLNLLDSVEDLKTSTHLLHKEKHSVSALKDERGCSFWLFFDWLWECLCCCTPTDVHTPLRRF